MATSPLTVAMMAAGLPVLGCSESNMGIVKVGCRCTRAVVARGLWRPRCHGWRRAHGSGTGEARTGAALNAGAFGREHHENDALRTTVGLVRKR